VVDARLYYKKSSRVLTENWRDISIPMVAVVEAMKIIQKREERKETHEKIELLIAEILKLKNHMINNGLALP